MAVLRGKGLGLEVALGGSDFESGLADLQSKLGERPGFYTGTQATAAFGPALISSDQLALLRAVLHEHGIALQAVCGGPSLEPLAHDAGLRFHPADDGGEELARRRALRPKREITLSDAARSLVADFAGARADIAERRQSGQTSVRRYTYAQPPAAPALPAAAAAPQTPAPAAAPSTLYHTGTLRGGQALHNIGNIVIIGDVNPGAELVASGDIVVFGSLRGVAHAGAQGDASARVYAIDLSPTQLRIATCIAADAGERARAAVTPEVAFVKDGRIAITSKEQAV